MLKTYTRTLLGRALRLSLLAALALASAPAAADETYVVDLNAGPGGSGALFRVDAISGNRSLVSDFGNPAQGPLGLSPHGLALEADGAVLVIDQEAGTGGDGALFRIDRLSGLRNLVSDFGSAGQGDLGVSPADVAVVVPNCEGRLPTVVGDNGNNVLIGSPRADVILGRAGADRIDGRAVTTGSAAGTATTPCAGVPATTGWPAAKAETG